MRHYHSPAYSHTNVHKYVNPGESLYDWLNEYEVKCLDLKSTYTHNYPWVTYSHEVMSSDVTRCHWDNINVSGIYEITWWGVRF